MSGSGVPARRPIRRLDTATIDRIAAGEVVERPASVVKELVENALDAGAGTVTVRITNGGLEEIAVADDGLGIPPAELDLAVERHATSKLDPNGALELIGTLGFRGEALAAISAVARLRLISRPPEGEAAEGVSLVGGTPAGRFAAPRAPGTTVEVSDLFFNTPARRKFLKSPAAEQVEVARTLERIYLARPTVTFRLEAEGSEIAAYPSTTDVRDAAARVLGTEFLHGSFRVAGEVPGGRVHGYLGRPPLAATSSQGLYLAVNGRAIGSRPLQQAVRAAFGDYLPRARFPVGVLHLEVTAGGVDVNVHPTKHQVRFARDRELVEAVRVRVREGLVGAPQVAELAEQRADRAVAPPRGTTLAADLAELVLPAVSPPDSPLVVARQRTFEVTDAPESPVRVGPAPGHPALTLLACLDALYWVAESSEGLLLIDQHAASERVVYESLRRELPVARQALVQPYPVRLSGAQRSALDAHAGEVARAGFEIELFGPGTHCVRTVPTFAGRHSRPESVTGLLDELAAGGRPTQPEGLVERVAASLACHAAIRGGDVVPPAEFSKVLDALYALPESAFSCPHGRPIMLRIPRSRLDRWFLRSGP
jgi:DNA mismatch repair protein MutL